MYGWKEGNPTGIEACIMYGWNEGNPIGIESCIMYGWRVILPALSHVLCMAGGQPY